MLTATATAKIADTYDGTPRVHYVAADSHVHELGVAGGVWQDKDLTSAAAGAPAVMPGTSIASVTDAIYGTVRVHYIDVDAHIHELYIAGGYWYDGDLTAVAGAPLPAAGSPIVSLADVNDGFVRVHYIAADSHVHELRITNAGWQHRDLTSEAGALPVMSGSSMSSVADAIYGTVRVHYIAANGHVHELYLAGGQWYEGDLTSVASAPLPGAGSPITSLADVSDGVARVYYIAADSHVHELRVGSAGWQHRDLTAEAGGPAAAPRTIHGERRRFHLRDNTNSLHCCGRACA